MKNLQILGVDFSAEGPRLPERLIGAGLVVVPSGPGLACDLPRSAAYRQALLEADWVLPDSGLMVLVWNLLHAFAPGKKLERYSGLRLLREVLPRPEVQAPGASFWIMPTREEQERNLAWLRANGFAGIDEASCYLAPLYKPDAEGRIEDAELVRILEARKPAVIFVNVGGGVQEQLGWFLRRSLSYRPAILCTGAAIAFLTGGQADIPPWADRFYLGWLLRVLENPARFGRRYLASIGLVEMLVRYRDKLPV